MATLRCPTCFTVLADRDTRRCPACQTKLRKQKPVVLRESQRLSSRPTSIDAELTARADALYQQAAPRPAAPQVPVAFRSAPAPERELVARVEVEPEPTFARPPEPQPTFARPPEPQPTVALAPEPVIDLTREHRPGAGGAPAGEPGIDLTAAEPEAEAAPAAVERSPLEGDLNEMIAELFRKARAELDDADKR